MLERLAMVAGWLRPLSGLLAALGLGLLVVVAVLIVTSTSERTDRWLFPALIGLLWSGCAWLFVHAFAHVPPPPGPPPHSLARFRAQLERALHWLLAIAFAGLSLSLVSLTGRLFDEWTR